MNSRLYQRRDRQETNQNGVFSCWHTKSKSAGKADCVPDASAGSELIQVSVPESFPSRTTTNTLPYHASVGVADVKYTPYIPLHPDRLSRCAREITAAQPPTIDLRNALY